jgi:hypothetical protein
MAATLLVRSPTLVERFPLAHTHPRGTLVHLCIQRVRMLEAETSLMRSSENQEAPCCQYGVGWKQVTIGFHWLTLNVASTPLVRVD